MYPFIDLYHSEIADLTISFFRCIWNIMQPKFLIFPNPLGLKHLIISWPSKLIFHSSNSLIMESSTLSSQPISSLRSSWSSLLSFRIKGVRNPSVSHIDLKIDNIPLRVIGFSFRSIWNLSVSLSISQQTPNALSSRSFPSRPLFLAPSFLWFSGTDLRIPFLLEVNLVTLKPPSWQIFLTFCTS